MANLYGQRGTVLLNKTAVHGSFGFYNRADRAASYPDCNGTYEEQYY